MTQWHKGNPPHIGWWNASCCQLKQSWRWWDGKTWSLAVTPRSTAEKAGKAAKKPYEEQDIEWTYCWPENARVPRTRPDTLWNVLDSATGQDRVFADEALSLIGTAKMAEEEAYAYAEALSDETLKGLLLDHMERL